MGPGRLQEVGIPHRVRGEAPGTLMGTRTGRRELDWERRLLGREESVSWRESRREDSGASTPSFARSPSHRLWSVEDEAGASRRRAG